VTVIAAFAINDVPLIISDMLTSGVETSGLELPAIGPAANLPQSEHTPSDLMQKLVVFAPNLALAFAGDVDRALRIIRARRRLAKESTITKEIGRTCGCPCNCSPVVAHSISGCRDLHCL
jgi:hypothetical protein